MIKDMSKYFKAWASDMAVFIEAAGRKKQEFISKLFN